MSQSLGAALSGLIGSQLSCGIDARDPIVDQRPVGTNGSERDSGTAPGAGAKGAGTSSEGKGGSGSSCAAPSPSLELPAYGIPMGTPPYEIDPGSGLAVAWPADLTRWAGSIRTDRNGIVELAADGSFTYLPPGGEQFWGDDRFVLGDAGAQSTVRLTVQPRGLDLTALDAGRGNGFALYGAAGGPSVVDAGVEVGALVGGDVAAAGDVNADGYADVIVGGYQAEGTGVAYVVFGTERTSPLHLQGIASGDGEGFAIRGGPQTNIVGFDVAGVGDINGDGLDDLMVSAFSPTRSDGPIAGMVYVVFGKADTGPVSLPAIDAGAGGGFPIRGADVENSAAMSVARAGDVNGDGQLDLLVGLYRVPGSTTGAAYVIFGRQTWTPMALPEVEQGRGGFVIRGADTSDRAGSVVAAAGDVNGDGLDDVILGAGTADPGVPPDPADSLPGTGAAYVVFGKVDTGPIALSSLEGGKGTAGFAILGIERDDGAGERVSGAGDVNGDGLDDVIVGARRASPAGVQSAGSAYVVFGKADSTSVNLSSLEEASLGFAVHGTEPNAQVGSAVSVMGDLNGDGFDDVLVGATDSFPGRSASRGRAYVVLGGRDAATRTTASLENGAGGFVLTGLMGTDGLGMSISGIGDVNRDGLGDWVVGADRADSEAGRAYVLFGWDTHAALDARRQVIAGGPASDVLDYAGGPLTSVDGGNGKDTLRLASRSLTLDLSGLTPRVRSIEVIDLSGCGDNTLRLSDTAVRRLPQSRADAPAFLAKTLTVLGDAGDRVELDLEGYEREPDSSGRRVYRKAGASYGIEVSSSVSLVPPR